MINLQKIQDIAWVSLLAYSEQNSAAEHAIEMRQ